MRDTSIGAYDHQELPFEQMVEALNVERDTSRNPLVQVMLQLIELPGAGLEQLDGLAVQSLPSRSDSAKLDLSFDLRRSADQGLSASITYAKDLFDGDRIERLSAHLLTLLDSVVRAPDQPAATLNLLPEPERQLIESWQQGPVVEVPDLCVHQLFEQQVERTPDAIALIFEEQQLTYRELNIRANLLAHLLIDRGVEPEQIVAVCIERSIEMVVALLAILKAGGAYLPLDPAWPLLRLGQILADAAPAVVIGSSRSASLIQAAGMIAADALLAIPIRPGDSPEGDGIESFWQPAGPLSDPAGNPGRRQDQATAAYLLYTSGTTGTPKGVLIEHTALVGRTIDLVARLRLDPTAVVLAHTALSFDISIVEVLMPLTGGARVVLTTEQQHRDPAALIRLVTDQRVNRLQATPSQWEALLRSGYKNQPQILAIAGGEALPAPLAEAIRRQSGALINGYGPTEVTIYASMQTVDADTSIGIGKPLANTSAVVLDRDGRPCPIGIAGELFLGGCGVARGYWKRVELTQGHFVSNPVSAERLVVETTERLYATGDLANWNPDGTLAFHGRIDQQIKLRGFRIEPGEIEAALLDHPAVGQAVALLRHDDPNNPRLIAYWVADASQQTTPSANAEQLRAFLADRLPDYMVPSAFVALEALPLTTNGKLDRKALPAPSFSGDLQQRVEPSTDLERQLHAMWAEVLGNDEFGISDNFFSIGGHSLAAARLVAAIEEQGSQSLRVADVFRLPTIVEQAELINAISQDQSEASASPQASHLQCLVTLQPIGERPPLFVIHGGYGAVGHFIDLGRALAPHRPVYGLQAAGRDRDLQPEDTVRSMAASYAKQIMERRPKGPVHLLGASSGGWYAHAVAAALLERGAEIGLCAILDTHCNARIHRRIQLLLTWSYLIGRLRVHLKALLIEPPSGQRRVIYLVQRFQTVNRLLGNYFGWPRLTDRADCYGAGDTATARDQPDQAVPKALYDPFTTLLRQEYRPPRLPIEVDVFAPSTNLDRHQSLWKFYARRGVCRHPLFQHHGDFFKPELMPQLANAIENALIRIESRHPK